MSEKTEKSPAPHDESKRAIGIQQAPLTVYPPTEIDLGAMRRANGEKGREVDCGVEVFTYGGRHYGPGVVFIEDPMAADRVESRANELLEDAGLKSHEKMAADAKEAVLAGDSSQNYLIPGNLPDGSTTGVLSPGPNTPHPVHVESLGGRGVVPVRRNGESTEQMTKRVKTHVKETDKRSDELLKREGKREKTEKTGDDPAVIAQREREKAQQDQAEAERKRREAEEKGRTATKK